MTAASVEPFIGRRVTPVGEKPTGGHDPSRLSAQESGAGGFLLGAMVRDGFGLLGPQRIARSESVDRGITEQYRRALPFNIAEVGPVLSVTNQPGQPGTAMPRHPGATERRKGVSEGKRG